MLRTIIKCQDTTKPQDLLFRKIYFVLGLLPRNSMLRTTPLTEALNPLSKMEFYAGHKRPGEAESMHPRSKVDYLLMESL